MKKLIRWVKLNTVCKIKGHESAGLLYSNGYKKGNRVYQRKCARCNRFFGEKEK